MDLCKFDWAIEDECNHTMDAVVECYGGEPTGKCSSPEQCTIDELQEQLALSKPSLYLTREELKDESISRIHDMKFLNETMSSRYFSTDIFLFQTSEPINTSSYTMENVL